MNILSVVSAIGLLALSSSVALADDWIADRLRGSVLQLTNGDWQSVARGDVVADGAMVRTESDGRVDLVRGQEVISLSTNTEITLHDRGDQRMTNVIQTRGTVTVSAERRAVQHLSVQTPVLAAVVKGTQFTVTYSNGRASVSVESGTVEVHDAGHDMVVDITSGQVAEASQMRAVDVSGAGAENVVFTIEGQSVPAAARDAVIKGDLAPEDAEAAVESGAIAEIVRGGGRGNAGIGPATEDKANGRPGGPGPHGNGGPKADGPKAPGEGPGKKPENEQGSGHGGHGPGNGNGNGNGPGANNGNGPGSSNGHGPGSNNGNGPGSNSGSNGNGPRGDGPGKGRNR